MMKPAFFSFIFATLLLTGCASNPNSSSNHTSDFVPAPPHAALGASSPTNPMALSNSQINVNNSNTNVNNTLPKPNNPSMNMAQNQQNYPKSVSTEMISGPGFSGMSQSVSVNGFTAQMSQGSSRSSRGGAF